MLRMAWMPYAFGAQCVLLLMTWHTGPGVSSAACLGLSSAATFFILRWLFRHKRAILDTPTSRVASAAQGYIELCGRAERHGDSPLLSKLTNLPCVWYRYSVEQRRHDHRWQRIDHGESKAAFRLRDDTGACVIDPQGAEVIARRKDHWTRDGYRFTEELLLEGETLYALGDLASQGGAADAPARATVLQTLLNRWKQDQPTLLARFDLDGNGQLDTREWQLARSAATREATAEWEAGRTRRAQAALRRPAAGQPYLISNFPPEQLARRYRSWFHATAVLLVIQGIAWAIWLYESGVR